MLVTKINKEMKQSFDIKTDVFEGPLELLLQLIEKRKLFVNDVALAEVADDFIQYIENAEDFPLEQTSYFILVASTLVLIKSKSLLPNLELTDDEQSNIDELEKRLLLYKRYKELSKGLEKIFGKSISIVPAKKKRIVLDPVFTPSEDLGIPTLLHLISDVLSGSLK